jgi:hypothetical protein
MPNQNRFLLVHFWRENNFYRAGTLRGDFENSGHVERSLAVERLEHLERWFLFRCLGHQVPPERADHSSG